MSIFHQSEATTFDSQSKPALSNDNRMGMTVYANGVLVRNSSACKGTGVFHINFNYIVYL